MQLLDPTNEIQPALRPGTKRPASLAGLTIGFLDIAKTRGDVFLDSLQQQFAALGLVVKRYAKPTYAHPAPIALQQQIALDCDVVVEALAD